MNSEMILQKLEAISKIPNYGTEEYEKWLEQKEFLQFLLDTSIAEIPLYVSYKQAYIYSVLLPQASLKGDYIDNLMRWQCPPDSSWGYGYSCNKRGKQKASIFKPFDSAGSELLKKARPITFLRCFEGRISQKCYV